MAADVLIREVQSQYQQLSQAVANGRHWHSRYLQELEQSYRQQLRDLGLAFWAGLEFGGEERAAGDMLLDSDNGAPPAATWAVLPWEDEAWSNYDPQAGAPIPAAVRIGRFAIEQAFGDLPALLPLPGQGHIFLAGDDPAAVRTLLQTLLLRLVVSFPPRGLRLHLADPAGLGANLAAFLRLPENWRGDKVCSRPDEIGRQLEALESHIESVLQDRLRNVYATIEDYNQAEGEMAVPYVIFALADFPAAFDERMAERLLHIAQNGPRAGVHLLASLNSAYPKPRNFKMGALTDLGTQLRLANDRQAGSADESILSWTDADFGHYLVIPDRLPPPAQVNARLDAVRKGIEGGVSRLDFRRIAIPPAQRWRGDATDGLSAAIGLDSTGGIHRFAIGQEGVVHHGLVGGITRSGKTNLLHVLITQLALAYSPDELQMYLVDFREGVGFQDYLHLPHARVVALESEREFGFSILRRLQQEIKERGELFKSPAHPAEEYVSYRQQTRQSLPRLLLIMDEFQVLFSEDDYLARESARMMEDIVRRGAGFGIHLLLSSQSPSVAGMHLARIYNQMGLRIALRSQTQDAQAILGEGNDAANQLSQPGDAIYNDEMGHKAKNVLMRVALLPPPARRSYLQEIQHLAGERVYPAPITFAAHAPARLEANTELQALLAQPGWPLPQPADAIWLGEPIEIKAATAATMERYMRSNLLVAGGDEAQAYGLLAAALLSLAAQRRPEATRFVVIDFSRPTSPLASLFLQLAQALPHRMAVTGPRQATVALDELAALLDQRKSGVDAAGAVPYLGSGTEEKWNDHQQQSGVDAAEAEVYFFIAGLRQWRELRGSDLYVQSDAANKLARLADEGPEMGIHLLVWADALAVIEPVFKRGGLGYFDLRVALHLPEAESNALLGDKAAARLDAGRALFRDEGWEMGRLEKFKPYPAPAAETLSGLLDAIRRKGGLHAIAER